MTSFINPVILTTNTHPYILGLTLFALALLASLTAVVISMTNLHTEYDCEQHDPVFFIDDETRALLDAQDPLKDYPHGRFVMRAVSARRARKQSANRALLRHMLEADWAESSYGTIAKGPRVGEKRKMRLRDEVLGRGKRVRMEGSDEDEDEDEDCGEW